MKSLRKRKHPNIPSIMSAYTAIRDASPGDVEAIARIYAPYVVETLISFEEVAPSASEMLERFNAIKDKGLPYLVAVLENEVVGYSYASPFRPRTGYRFTVEGSVYVETGKTGRGIGKALMQALIERCEQGELKTMVAIVAGMNRVSIDMLIKLGFQECGVIRDVGRKHGQWIDDLFLQRDLGGIKE